MMIVPVPIMFVIVPVVGGAVAGSVSMIVFGFVVMVVVVFGHEQLFPQHFNILAIA